MNLSPKKAALVSAAIVAAGLAVGAAASAARADAQQTEHRNALHHAGPLVSAQLAQRFDPNDVSGVRDKYRQRLRMCYRLRTMIRRARTEGARRYYRIRYYRLCRR